MRCDNAHAITGILPIIATNPDDGTPVRTLGSPFHVGEKWPNLGEFIRMVHDWYLEHRDRLPKTSQRWARSTTTKSPVDLKGASMGHTLSAGT